MTKKKTKKELEQELIQLKEECEKLKEEKLRLLADIQNLHKRLEREKEEARKAERRGFILQIADLLDLSLQALEHAAGMADEANAKGFMMIKDELEKRLKALGVEIHFPLGEKFDYKFHHVVSAVDSDKDEGTILEVIKRGILFEGEVLRPALVVVSKKQK